MRSQPAARRCQRCGAQLSRYNPGSVCAICEAHPEEPANLPHPIAHPLLWTSPPGRALLATRDVGAILRTYRRATGLTQAQLGRMLVLDQSYVSRIEGGERVVTDVRSLARIADAFGVPLHALGLSSDDGADFATALQFASSTLRLAEVVRQSGRAMDAVAELWPLLMRLQARAIERRADRHVFLLLGRARLSLGVALGHVLPEERLMTAARWTQRALSLAIRLEHRPLEADALRMHGNELRKAGHHALAIRELARAATRAEDAPTRGWTYALLARATAEVGDVRTFDAAIAEAQRLLDTDHGPSALFNAFTVHEIRVRGLLATGRARAARALADPDDADGLAVPPQWRVLNAITSGTVSLESGDEEAALEQLGSALAGAERYRLPHQIQRVQRILAAVPGERAAALAGSCNATLRRVQLPLPTDPVATG